jgi:hypothetical protein
MASNETASNVNSSEGRARINILDIVIIIVFAALIAGLFFRESIVSIFNKDDMADITYAFEIKSMERTRLSDLAENVRLTDKNSGKDMGKIKLVNAVNAYVTEYKNDGSAVKIKKDGYCDAVVTASAKGFKSDTGVFLGGELLIVPGQTFTIYTETTSYNVTILSVN